MSGDDALMDTFRKACLQRGVAGIKQIGRSFRIYDDDSNKSLSFDEFSKGVHDYGVKMSQDDLQRLFHVFDKDGSESIDFNEFLIKLRPPMSKSRLVLIEKAFTKMDTTGDGVITVQDLLGSYDVRKHPKFSSGQMTKEAVLHEFLNNFQADKDDTVTKQEFFDYYAGVSASIDEDIYFDYMMRQAWKL